MTANTTEIPLLEPGLYALSSTVVNQTPVRGSRGSVWHKQKVIEAGKLFIVERRFFENAGQKTYLNSIRVWSHPRFEAIQVSPRKLKDGEFDLAAEIIPLLRKTKLSLNEILSRESATHILITLFEKEIVTLEGLDKMFPWRDHPM